MKQPVNTQIRPEVRDVLSTLKSKIRLYVCVEGLALLLVVLSLLFWTSYSIDWFWYWFSKSQMQAHVKQYELSTWFRIGFDVLAVGVLVAAACYWIGLRPFRSMRSKALALVLERRFPGLNDRIVTSVELAESVTGQESPLTVSMLNRTVDSAAQDASRIHVAEVFETKPVRWAVMGAIFAMVSVAGYGIANADDFSRWARAYLNLDPDYWVRETQLNLQVIASPNERVREFTEVEDDKGNLRRVFKHPRGGDLTLLVTVPGGNNVKGKPFVIPDEVRVYYKTAGGDGKAGEDKSGVCTQVGDRKFKLSFAKVVEGMTLWVAGGDFKSRIPYEVELVDPPEAVAMQLQCDYPAYTGMNDDPTVEVNKEVRGRQVKVPLETRFRFEVRTNKELHDARLEFGRYRVEFGSIPVSVSTDEVTGRVSYERRFRANLKIKGLDKVNMGLLSAAVGLGYEEQAKNEEFTFPIPEKTAKNFFHPDKRGFDLPFIVSDRASDASRARFEKRRATGEYFAIERDGVDGLIDLGMPFVMNPGTDIRTYLEDTDEIGSIDPGKVTVNVDRDQPPEIKDVVRQGIGIAVTANAEIPISAKISDDYGIVSSNFEFRIAVGSKAAPGPWRTWTFDNEPGNRPKEFILSRTDVKGNKEAVERFPVSLIKVRDETIKVEGVDPTRDLKPGDVITLSIVASDADNLNGPHITRSVPLLTFRVVTPEELFYLLGQKEGGIRMQFEKVVDEVQKLRNELEDRLKLTAELRDLRLASAKAGVTDADRKKIAALEKRIKLTASRAKAQIVENRNETRGVQKGFEDIRAELVNNKLFTEEQASRIEVSIIKVLVGINDDDYPLVEAALDLYDTKVNQGAAGAGISKDPTDDIQLSLDRTDAMLVHMRAALEKMKQTQIYTKVLKMLFLLTEQQRKLKEATAELERQESLRRLKELQDLQNGGKP